MGICSSQKLLLLSSRCYVMIVHATSPIAILAPLLPNISAHGVLRWMVGFTYSSSSPALSLFFFFLLLDAAPSFFWCTTSLVHDSSLSHSKPARTGKSSSSSAYTTSHQLSERVMAMVQLFTFFLNCLWMASSASLMVTPFRFRAVTSSPRGK